MSVEELLALQARLVGELGERAARGIDPSRMSLKEILAAHAALARELQRRNIARNANNPTRDIGIHILCTALGWRRVPAAAAAHDATDADGRRYLVRTRRMTGFAAGESFSSIRGVASQEFDTVAAIALDEGFSVLRAALVPRAVVAEKGEYEEESDTYTLRLVDAFSRDPRIEDVTRPVRAWADAPPPARVERSARQARPRRRPDPSADTAALRPALDDPPVLDLDEDRQPPAPSAAAAPAPSGRRCDLPGEERAAAARRPSNRLRSAPSGPRHGAYGPLGGASSGTVSPSR